MNSAMKQPIIKEASILAAKRNTNSRQQNIRFAGNFKLVRDLTSLFRAAAFVVVEEISFFVDSPAGFID